MSWTTGSGPDRSGGELARGSFPITSFFLRTEVAGTTTTATWNRSGFSCHPRLLDMAAVLTALDEPLAEPKGRPSLRATTDPARPIELLLTLIKAGGAVRSCQIDFSDSRF